MNLLLSPYLGRGRAFFLIFLLGMECLLLPSVFPPLLAGEEKNRSGEELLELDNEIESEEWKKKSDQSFQETFLGPEEYAVSSSKYAQSLRESPSAVTVLNRDDTKAYGIATLEELLRIIPGVSVVDLYPSYHVLTIRGFGMTYTTGNAVLFLIDGQEINTNIFGGVFWSLLPISLDDIERIEVIRGPGSALYGANAFSGVINIKTRNPHDLKTVKVLSEAGAYDSDPGTLFVKATGAAQISPVSFLASADYQQAQSRADPDKDMFQTTRTRAKVMYEPTGDLQVNLDGGYMQAGLQYRFYLGDLDIKDSSIYYGNLVSTYRDLRFQVYFRRFNFTFDIDTPLVLVQPYLNRLTGHMDNLEGKIEYSRNLPARNRLSLGGSFLTNIFYSRDLMKKYNDEKRFGLFLQDEWNPLKQILVNVSLRYDENSIFDRSFSPRASLVYLAHRDHSLRISFGQAFRKPGFYEYGLRLRSFQEAGPPFSEMLGGKGLKNERINAYEVGYQGHYFRRFQLLANGFFDQYRNIIAFYNSDVTFKNFRNYADDYGFELSLEAFLRPGLSGFVNYSFLQLLTKSEEAKFRSNEKLYPQHKINLGFRASFWKRLLLSTVVNYISQTENFMMDPNSSTVLPHDIEPAQKLGPILLWNVRAGYEVLTDRLEVGIKISNLLDDNSRQFPGLTWQRQAPEEPINWGGEELRRTITAFLEASF